MLLIPTIQSAEEAEQAVAFTRYPPRGVDGVFIGPGDLSAGLGYLGQTSHPDVRKIIEDAIRRIAAAGNAPGILTPIEEEARAYMDAGSLFTAVGSDAGLLARASEKIAQNFKGRK